MTENTRRLSGAGAHPWLSVRRLTFRRLTARGITVGLAAGALLAPLLAVPAGAVTISAPDPDGQLAALGPTDPTTGFPYWYEDKDGTRLELCLDAAECPLMLRTRFRIRMLPHPFRRISRERPCGGPAKHPSTVPSARGRC